MKLKNFINSHFDFKVYPVTIIAFLVFLSIFPCIKFLPVHYGYENGLLENIQMLVLGIGLFMTIKSKVYKNFFRFATLILTVIILREINYGRTIFFPIPGEVNAYYSWKEIKYGWMVNPLIGLYLTGIGLYFIINKIYLDLWEILTKIKFPVWNIILMLTGMGLGMYAEKATENFVFEEITELLFYVSLVGIIWLYTRKKITD